MKSIINKSLSSGILTQCFKHALVKPLLRKASLETELIETLPPCFQYAILVKGAGAYCPEQFLQHLESHSLLEPSQSAYRKCHNTKTALLRVVNDLPQASDSG